MSENELKAIGKVVYHLDRAYLAVDRARELCVAAFLNTETSSEFYKAICRAATETDRLEDQVHAVSKDVPRDLVQTWNKVITGHRTMIRELVPHKIKVEEKS